MDARTPGQHGKTHYETLDGVAAVSFVRGNERKALPYLYFREMKFADGVITLQIGEWIIKIEGHNLLTLYKDLQKHRVVEVEPCPELAKSPKNEKDVFCTALEWTTAEHAEPAPHADEEGEPEEDEYVPA